MAKYDGVGHDEHPHHFHMRSPPPPGLSKISSSAVLAALRPKMLAPHADSTVFLGDKNYCKFYSKQYPLPVVSPPA